MISSVTELMARLVLAWLNVRRAVKLLPSREQRNQMTRELWESPSVNLLRWISGYARWTMRDSECQFAYIERSREAEDA